MLITRCMTAMSCGKKENGITVREVETKIQEFLRQGDARDKVESFLIAVGTPYSYDKFMNRYQFVWPDSDAETLLTRTAIQVYIYLDKEQTYSIFEVKRIAQSKF